MTDTLKRWVAERRRIAEAATPGPWNEGGIERILLLAANDMMKATQHKKDAAFMADARNCMSILLQIIEVQDAALESLELGHEHGPTEPHCRPLGDSYGWCDYCHTKMSWGEDAAKEARAAVEALLLSTKEQEKI